ncbi:DUF1284 domain-containing protein [Kumtagia ephedrae]|uniref:DUF1284 domain-containing protein n=1 Tax=Kumtagia ephedrae TaxID=2116701 RepID=A0A2P7RJW6_9HYPH|nr:DUF1284 domain-containing protein [Mesorhizobium ephedrae]PSJ50502.1 DUF1284 domain-containing protein [Mesorhizobium ephedrae]
MTVRLRAHHLLCMLTYVGKGYSAAFTDNYDAIVERLSGGEDILLVAGPDDICRPLLGEDGAHCLNASVVERDALAAAAVGGLLGRPLGPGQRIALDPAVLARMREAFRQGTTRRACSECEWLDLCSRVSAGGFTGTKLVCPG